MKEIIQTMQLKTPKISIIMPTWNRLTTLPHAINSVLAQVYINLELIIIDDGSTDGTAGFMDLFLNQYDQHSSIQIIYKRFEKIGVSAARNAGINLASGELIAYLDSDNQWHPTFTQRIITHYQQSQFESAYTAVNLIHTNGEGDFTLFRPFCRTEMLYQNYIDLNCFVHRKTLIDKFGAFSTKLTRLVDWDLILRMTKHSSPLPINERLVDYHVNSSLIRVTTNEPLFPNIKKIISENLAEISATNIPKLINDGNRLTYGTLAQPEWHSAWKRAFNEIYQEI
jgi:glycosyltransferase involved in cell wall biosynthesis